MERKRTKSEVLELRKNAVAGGCCENFGNQMGCNCLAEAEPDKVDEVPTVKGMTLRDYFAGQALKGIIANKHHDPKINGPENPSKWAYQYADEMLKERGKQG